MGNAISRGALALRLALLGLRRSAGTTALATGVLALGLAAPTVFFSLLVGAVRPLPVPGGERVVRVDVVRPAEAGGNVAVTGRDLQSLAGGNALGAVGGFRTTRATLVDPGVATTRLSLAALTPQVLPLLRVSPEIGRVPDGSDAASTLLLGHELWQELYGGDPDVLGRSVTVDGRPRTVVGVMPAGFGFPFNQNAWTVLPRPVEGESLELVGRLADGATLEGAEAELAGRWRAGDRGRPVEARGGVVEVDGFTRGRGEGGEGVAFLGLVLVALCLLLIACANVANLLLVRATERVRSLGIQSALGAGRLQIAAQLLLEALLLAAAGGGLGLLLAGAALDGIQGSLAAQHFGYHWMRMGVDGTAVAFTTALVLGTALVAGTLPVVRVLKADVQDVLKEKGSGGAMGGGGAWGRAFVTGQLALSCAALAAAGITGRALAGSRSFGAGLPAGEILVASADLADADGSPAQVAARLEERLEGIPGTVAGAVALGAPGYFEPFGRLEVEGIDYPRPQDRPRATYNAVTPGFFRVMGLELRAGRLPGPEDGPGAAPVAVVNRSFVERFLDGGDVLGRRIRVGFPVDSAVWRTVVGVVEDAGLGGGESAREDRVYLPYAQLHPASLTRLTLLSGSTSVVLLTRRPGDAAGQAPALRRAAAEVDSRIPLWSVRTLDDAHAYISRVPMMMAGTALAGGAIGLLVAAVGLYGLLAFRVRQRRRELGVRMALGADGRRLAGEVLVVALRQVVPALAVGLTLAWIAAPVLGAFLMGQNPRSPATFAGVAGTFLVTALVAAVLPAIRAAAVDPARVLKSE